jgi:hypothetical protein
MRMRALALGMIVLCAAAGCAKAKAKEGDAEPAELAPQLKALVLDSAPSDIPHPLYVDFNAKAELLGYALEPEALAPPGSKLSLKLYWRSTGALDEGYTPFTELVTPAGQRIEVSGTGPVRKGELSPSHWEAGKVYVDELSVTVPADIDSSRFSLVVGLKTEPVAPPEPALAEDPKKAEKKPEAQQPTFGAVYLSVLSGPADTKRGAVIATLETGVTLAALRARAARDDKRAPGAVKRVPPGGKLPVSAKPRPSAP